MVRSPSAPPARVAVVGSTNVDLVFAAPRQPGRGETLRGTAFDVFTGGKGGNQALAAARAGGRVSFVGRAGADSFGEAARAALEADGVDLRYSVIDPEAGTGVAGIVVEPDGANSIVVVPRANGRLGEEDVRRAAPAIRGADALLLQLETPLGAVGAAAHLAREAGIRVLLNPAPVPDPLPDGGLPDDLLAPLELADVLVPNETEAEQLTGIPTATDEGAARAGRALLARGPAAVLITLGSRGAVLVEAAGEARLAPFSVPVVDTTAAGDAFCGALAVSLAEGRPLVAAARFAGAAGALAVTVAGAGPSLPRRPEIERLLATAPA
jgi:ribokinase